LPETPPEMGMGASQESFVMGTGIAADVLPDLERMLPRCYELWRWDEVGRPARERLEELGLWGGSCPADQANA
jgi:aldehyde:ferredoxin oxidoreductase